MTIQIYLTGNSLRARWQRWRLRRAYARPVTFADLRKIADAAAYRDGDGHNPDPTAFAIFNAICNLAEINVD
jgi:hypothetical protein